jgi:hypothetical protein
MKQFVFETQYWGRRKSLSMDKTVKIYFLKIQITNYWLVNNIEVRIWVLFILIKRKDLVCLNDKLE